MSVHQIVLTDHDTVDPEFALTLGLTDADAGDGEPLVWLNVVSLAEGTGETQHVNLAPTFGIYADDLLGSLSLLSDEWRFPRVSVVDVEVETGVTEDRLVMERCDHNGDPDGEQKCWQWPHFTPDALPRTNADRTRWYHCPVGGTA